MTPAEKQKRRTAKRATQQPNETEETENPRPWPHEHHFPEYVKQLREKALPELQKIVNQHPRINRHSRGITVTNYALHPKAQVDSHANISIHRDSITKEWTGGMALPLDEGRLASLIAHERRRYYDEMFGKLPNRLQARNANKRNHFEDMEYRKNLTALRGEIVDSLMPEDQRTADRQLAREMLAQLDQQELKAATELLGRGAELHDLTRLGEARACLKTAKGVDWEGSWDGSWDPRLGRTPQPHRLVGRHLPPGPLAAQDTGDHGRPAGTSEGQLLPPASGGQNLGPELRPEHGNGLGLHRELRPQPLPEQGPPPGPSPDAPARDVPGRPA